MVEDRILPAIRCRGSASAPDDGKGRRLVRSDGAMTENCYGISLEFPVVALGDMQIIAQDETLTSTCAGDGRRVSIRTE
jgi:hypothetical protein